MFKSMRLYLAAVANAWWVLVAGIATGLASIVSDLRSGWVLPTRAWVALFVAAILIAQFLAYHQLRVHDEINQESGRAREAVLVREISELRAAMSARRQDGEAQRRQTLLRSLRQEYVLSHDGLSPQLLAGTAPIPKDWVEARLSQLGEAWRQDLYF